MSRTTQHGPQTVTQAELRELYIQLTTHDPRVDHDRLALVVDYMLDVCRALDACEAHRGWTDAEDAASDIKTLLSDLDSAQDEVSETKRELSQAQARIEEEAGNVKATEWSRDTWQKAWSKANERLRLVRAALDVSDRSVDMLNDVVRTHGEPRDGAEGLAPKGVQEVSP